MIRGVEASRRGMAVEQTRTEVLANNVANMNTPGFKRSVAVSGEFQQMLLRRLDDQAGQEPPVVGTLGNGAAVEAVVSILRQGDLVETGRELDFALEGPGEFVLQGPDGLAYTRNGAFRITGEGVLVTTEGYPVLMRTAGGQLVPVTGLTSPPAVEPDGTLLLNGQPLGRLALENAGPDTRVHSRMLEASNVELAQEMADLIVALRSFQVNQRALQMQDETLGRAVSEIGKL